MVPKSKMCLLLTLLPVIKVLQGAGDQNTAPALQECGIKARGLDLERKQLTVQSELRTENLALAVPLRAAPHTVMGGEGFFYMYMCVCVFAHVSAHMYMWRPEADTRHFS